ncbi:hypothetical protein C8F01DRAFT_1084928 [Mycena amicta]|nr:hypothetical protein C8F01DRAFT_1084928 [Mycena amicta]
MSSAHSLPDQKQMSEQEYINMSQYFDFDEYSRDAGTITSSATTTAPAHLHFALGLAVPTSKESLQNGTGSTPPLAPGEPVAGNVNAFVCPNCGDVVNLKTIHFGHVSQTKVCHACYRYEHTKGILRPPELSQRTAKRRKGGGLR